MHAYMHACMHAYRYAWDAGKASLLAGLLLLLGRSADRQLAAMLTIFSLAGLAGYQVGVCMHACMASLATRSAYVCMHAWPRWLPGRRMYVCMRVCMYVCGVLVSLAGLADCPCARMRTFSQVKNWLTWSVDWTGLYLTGLNLI